MLFFHVVRCCSRIWYVYFETDIFSRPTANPFTWFVDMIQRFPRLSIARSCRVPYRYPKHVPRVVQDILNIGIITFASFHQRAHFIPIVGCGEREAHINWPMVTCKMAAPVTGTTLRTILALCRRTLGSERHWYAFA